MYHVLAQRAIDARLITSAVLNAVLEPSDHVGIKAKSQLLLDWPIEQTAFGARPVKKLRRVRSVDGIVGKRSKRLQLGGLPGGELLRSRLLHMLSFRARLLSGADDPAGRPPRRRIGPPARYELPAAPPIQPVRAYTSDPRRDADPASMREADRRKRTQPCRTTSRAWHDSLRRCRGSMSNAMPTLHIVTNM